MKSHVETAGIYLLAFIIRCLRLTYRIKLDDPNDSLETAKNQACIFTLWHNRLLFGIALFPRWVRQNTVAIASKSKDGGFAASYAKAFRIRSVRGSSSRGGARALIQLRKSILAGHHTAITIDGPRGPMYKAQPGAAFLAGATQAPIIPISVNSDRYWSLKSWDKTQIPKPFAKITLQVGKTRVFDSSKEEAVLEQQNLELEALMMEVTQDA